MLLCTACQLSTFNVSHCSFAASNYSSYPFKAFSVDYHQFRMSSFRRKFKFKPAAWVSGVSNPNRKSESARGAALASATQVFGDLTKWSERVPLVNGIMLTSAKIMEIAQVSYIVFGLLFSSVANTVNCLIS